MTVRLSGFGPSSRVSITPTLPSGHVSATILNPAELLGRLQATLDKARGEYAVRRFGAATQLLEEIDSLIAGINKSSLPTADRNAFALVQGSVYTMRGRLSRQHAEAYASFEKAVALFSQHAESFSQTGERTHTPNLRIYTDYGIALFRTWRHEQALKILLVVYESGAASAEALAYLGYVEMSQKQYGSSESRLRSALQISPSNPTVRYWLGRVLRVQAKHEEACLAFWEAGMAACNLNGHATGGQYGLWALHSVPNSDAALRLSAFAYYWSGRPRLALSILEKYLKHQPSNLKAWGLRGLLLRNCKSVEESIQALKAIKVTSTDDAWILGELAQSLLIAERAEEALQVIIRALELSADDSFLLRVRARVYIQLGQFDPAIVDLRRADQITPGLEDIALDLGKALLASEDIEAALEQWSKIAAEHPRYAGAQYALGYCYEKQGEYLRAVTHYRRSCRLEPANAEPLIRLLNLLIRQDRYDALEELKTHISGPLAYIALWKRGALQSQSGDWSDALGSLENSISAAKDSGDLQHYPEILLELGEVFRALGRYEEARLIYDEALEIAPNRVDVLFELAGYLRDLAAYTEANSILDQALAIDDSNYSLWDAKGWSLQHLGDWQEAREAYESAVKLSNRQDVWSLKGLANVLLEFDKSEAERIFAEILQQKKYASNNEQASDRFESNLRLLGLLGWCNYRLGRYDEAARLYQASLSHSVDMLPASFDLGLTLLAAGRIDAAHLAYQNAFALAEQTNSGILRSQYYIALFDLAGSIRHQSIDIDSAGPLMQELSKRLNAMDINVATLRWMPNEAIAN